MKKTTLNKQKRTIIALAAAFAVMLVLYFAVIAPLLRTDEQPEVLPELIGEGDIHGEVLGMSNRIQLFEQVPKNRVARLEIRNATGYFAFSRAEDGELYVEGAEASPHDSTLLSSLINDAGYTLSIERISMNCEDLSQYGLGEDEETASYTLTTVEGTKHTVYIGDLIPTGGGYYCRYEGRPAVYILGYSLENTLLVPVHNYFVPMLTLPIEDTDYYSITDFILEKDGEKFVHINLLGENEKQQNASISPFQMVYPGNYVPSGNNYESTILPLFSSFKGSSVVAVGPVDAILPPEVMSKFGIDLNQPAFKLHFLYNNIQNDVYFSAYNEEIGGFYAYSVLFNQIAVVPESSVPFLRWPFINYVDRSIFLMSIGDIASVQIACGDFDETFLLTGEKETLAVTLQGSGNAVSADHFRRLYQVMLSSKMEDYADFTDETITESDITAAPLRLKVTTRAGVVFDYEFFPYHTRRALYTVNGVGEFYLLRDQIDKILSDAQKVIDGIEPDPYGRS